MIGTQIVISLRIRFCAGLGLGLVEFSADLRWCCHFGGGALLLVSPHGSDYPEWKFIEAAPIRFLIIGCVGLLHEGELGGEARSSPTAWGTNRLL